MKNFKTGNKITSAFWRKTSRSATKAVFFLHFQKNFCNKNSFGSGTFKSFNHFRTLGETNTDCWRKNGSVVKTAFFMSTGTICWKIIFEDFFISPSTLREHFLATWFQKKKEGVSKQHYPCQMKHCEENLFLKNFVLFHSFLTICRRILKFWLVFFVMFVSTAFYVSTGTTSGKIVS